MTKKLLNTDPVICDNPVSISPVNIRNISMSITDGETYAWVRLWEDGEYCGDKSATELLCALIHYWQTEFSQVIPRVTGRKGRPGNRKPSRPQESQGGTLPSSP